MQRQTTPPAGGFLLTPQMIAERVYGIFRRDDADGVLLEVPHPPHLGSLTEHEADLRDYGLIFGMCFGVARAEDPWEPNQHVAARARDAAEIAYKLWGGNIADRNDGLELARAVGREYDNAWKANDGEPVMTDGLANAIERLASGIGGER